MAGKIKLNMVTHMESPAWEVEEDSELEISLGYSKILFEDNRI